MVFLVVVYFLYVCVVSFNKYTYKQYGYEFIENTSYFATATSYVLLFAGNKWYQSALANNTDTLNGGILITIGILILLLVIVNNFKKTDFIIGLFGTIFQLFIYVLLSAVGIIVLFFFIVAATQTRPVYSIN